MDLNATILQYWQQGVWRAFFNDLPIFAKTFSYPFHSRDELQKAAFSFPESTAVWVAPFIGEKPQHYFIPLWIPAVVSHGKLTLRNQLPWIPASLLDPRNSSSPFSAPLHLFDDWLPNEYFTSEKTVAFSDWDDLYQACVQLLDKFSDNAWEQRLIEKGYEITLKSWVIPEEHLFSLNQFPPQNNLLTEFSNVIETACEPNRLLAVRTPLGVDKKEVVDTILAQHQIQKEDLLVIDHAQQFLPQQIVPWLDATSHTLLLGDDNDLCALPCMSAFADEWELKRHLLTDEEILEEMHFKSMLMGNGNAFRIALVHNELAHPPQSLDKHLPKMVFEPVKGECVKQHPGFYNPQEAKAIVYWLKENPQAKAVVVTPFAAQQKYLQAFCEAHQVQCEIYTFHHLPFKQWPYVIFSPVLTHQQDRPFIFDQGEAYFYSMLTRALECFVIVGDDLIFDPKMHSPSGKIAKNLFLAAKTN